MRGGDTRGLRAYNERLIVGAIRQHGPLSKADLARATGLSAQAASMIVNALVADAILAKRPKVRGQVGQPYTPIALNPAGAFALGVKIGRRSVEAVALDLAGRIVAEAEDGYAAPVPASVMPRALAATERVLGAVPDRGRLFGFGVAMPGDLPAWSRELGLAPGGLDGWHDVDVAAVLADATGLDGAVYNDATAACAAELALGETPAETTALYVYLGTFVGGGLVLDGRLFRGARGNAGAIGSMPMVALDDDGRPRQLIHEASVLVLEHRLREHGGAGCHRFGDGEDTALEPVLGPWIDAAATALARAAVGAASVVDLDTVIIDGLLPPRLIARITGSVEAALPRFNTKGLAPLVVRTGSVGRRARVVGAALLPLNERFAPDPDVLVRGPRERAAAADAGDRSRLP